MNSCLVIRPEFVPVENFLPGERKHAYFVRGEDLILYEVKRRFLSQVLACLIRKCKIENEEDLALHERRFISCLLQIWDICA